MAFNRIWLFSALVAGCVATEHAPARSDLGKRVDAHAEVVRARIVANPSTGLVEAERLQQTARSSRSIYERLTAEWLVLEALVRNGRAVTVLKRASEALTALDRAGLAGKLKGNLLLTRGSAAEAVGRLQDAIVDYQNGYGIFVATSEPRKQAVALQKIASIYREGGDYRGARKYIRLANEAYSRDPLLLLTGHNILGNAYFDAGNYAVAGREYEQALRASRLLSSQLLEVRILQNLAQSYLGSNRLPEAAAALRRAYALASSSDAASWRPALDGVAALLAYKQGRLDDAARLVERSFTLTDTAKAAVSLRDLHQTAYQIFARRGDTARALHHLEEFKKLDDEKRAITASAAAALVSARFDFANQDAKIVRLAAEQERTRARFRATILYGLLAAATVISILLLIGFISLRRSRNQVRAANAELSGTNVALERALAAKGEFLATTSHEIRTPLNGILGMTQVILADRALPAPLRGRVELVHGAGETMKALVDDILDVAKMESGELIIHPADMDLSRLLEDAAQVWADKARIKGLALETDFAASPGRIVADEVRLRQIVFNLMANAIKFTDRGHVRVSATIAPGLDGDRLLIEVDDTGIGIAPEGLEAIFAAFQQIDGGVTRRHGGTGLGLAICRNLAVAMGGEIRVTSTLGAGSTFILDLPLTRAAAPPAARASRDIGGLTDAQLLLVEGNPLAQGILRAVLAGKVAELHVAGTCEAALEALRAGGIDHVLADGATLGLDPAVAGQLAAAARGAGARWTCLWPSPDDEMRTKLAMAGVDEVVAKPIGPADLLAAMKRLYDLGPETYIAAE